jgi:transcriptional regulator with XRE-family HTH domain
LQQLKRYEIGKNEPSAEAIRKIARTYNVSADRLLFDEDERGPDDDMSYGFEALSDFDPESKETARQLIHALIQQHQTKLLHGRLKKSA